MYHHRMPPRTAVSLIPSPLVPPPPSASDRPFSSDRCMQISAAVLSPVGWELMRREVPAAERLKKKGPFTQRPQQQRGLATQKGAGMPPDTLTWFLLLRYSILLWRVCNPLASLNNWLQDSFTAFSAHKRSPIMLRFAESCHLFVLSVDS